VIYRSVSSADRPRRSDGLEGTDGLISVMHAAFREDTEIVAGKRGEKGK